MNGVGNTHARPSRGTQMKRKFILAFGNTLMTIIIVVLLLALAINISTIWSIERINRGEKVESGIYTAIIGSGSMEPVISVKDLLFIKGSDSYQAKDIITYVSPMSSLITHRIKEVLPDGYIVQGDANNIADDEVSKQRVLGKVVHMIPGIGGIVFAILSPAGITLLVCIFILVLLIQKISGGKNENEQNKTKKTIEDT